MMFRNTQMTTKRHSLVQHMVDIACDLGTVTMDFNYACTVGIKLLLFKVDKMEDSYCQLMNICREQMTGITIYVNSLHFIASIYNLYVCIR